MRHVPEHLSFIRQDFSSCAGTAQISSKSIFHSTQESSNKPPLHRSTCQPNRCMKLKFQLFLFVVLMIGARVFAQGTLVYDQRISSSFLAGGLVIQNSSPI